MSLVLKGKLIRILAMESGVARSGNPWKKQEFVVETQDQYPKKICFTLFNDKVSLLDGIMTGDDLEVSFDIESREFNNKWYHNINAWKIERLNQKEENDAIPPVGMNDIPLQMIDDQQDDLPF